jgi:hypothetical protein
VSTGHALTYSSLITTMAMAGNTDGVIAVLEKWSLQEPRSVTILDRLGEAYLYSHRRDDAIRAFSSAAEFLTGAADGVATPDGFLNRRKFTK